MKITNIQNITPYSRDKNKLSNNQQISQSVAFGAGVTKAPIIDKILKNKAAQWAFKFASNNPFGFDILTLAATCIIMRPITIMALPGQKKDDKQYLAAKSIIASVIANSARIMLIMPLSKSLEHTGEQAKKEVNKIKFPIKGSDNFNAFNFAINKGFAFILSIGTAALMTLAIPKVMSKILPSPDQSKETTAKNNAKEVL